MGKQITYTISIPKPCHEGWSTMAPTEKGRFCQACQKEVIDFSKLNDDEIVQILKSSQGAICGHAKKSQLGREIAITEYPWKFPFRADLMAGLLMLAAMQPLLTQASPAPVKTASFAPLLPAPINEPDFLQTPPDTARQIRGTVVDSQSGKPLAFANISVDNMPQTAVVTDSNGKFVLTLDPAVPQEIQVTIFLVGYEPFQLTLTDKDLQSGQPLVVYLKEQEWLLEGVMIIEPKKDRTGDRRNK